MKRSSGSRASGDSPANVNRPRHRAELGARHLKKRIFELSRSFALPVLVAAILAPAPKAIAQTTPGLTPDEQSIGLAMVKKAGEQLAHDLRDPTSALFRNVHIGRLIMADKKRHLRVCFEVNARNGYGGMSGWTQYMVSAYDNYDPSTFRVDGDFAQYFCPTGEFDPVDHAADLKAAFNAALGE